MGFTPQQTALNQLTGIYGRRRVATEDHGHSVRVGVKVGPKTLWFIGDSWDEAIEALKAKVTE